MQARLQALQRALAHKNMLLMIDDVWEEALPVLLGPRAQLVQTHSRAGLQSCLLVTSRFTTAANNLADNADEAKAQLKDFASVMSNILLANATGGAQLGHMPNTQVRV